IKLLPSSRMSTPSAPPPLPSDYVPARRRGVDYVSRDGSRVIDVKLGAQGVRDLHGALIPLALLLEEDRSVTLACLVIRFRRVTRESGRQAWQRAKELLRAHIAERLALVLLTPDEAEPWFEPRTSAVAEIAQAVAGMSALPEPGPSSPASPKLFEVW